MTVSDELVDLMNTIYYKTHYIYAKVNKTDAQRAQAPLDWYTLMYI